MAEIPFYVGIDLKNNDLKNATIGTNTNIATLAGSFQYDSGSNRLQYYDGTTTQSIANLNDLVGGLYFKGGYNAATNTPDLVAPLPGAVLEGYFYVVTNDGTFFGEQLRVGDSLIAKVDNPSALADWVILQANVDLATTSTPGIIYLADQTQVNTGTEAGAYAITPATLQAKLETQSYVATILTGSWSGSPGNYSVGISHSLNADGVVVSFIDGSGNNAVFGYTVVNSNTITVTSNSNPNNITVSIVKAYAP